MARLHRFLAVLAALLLVAGALPASSAAQAPLPACSVATGNSIPSAANFSIPPHSLAVLRGLPGYTEVVTRVPLGVQANVTGGSGTYWVYIYDQFGCTENQLEQVARRYAWDHGLVVADISSLQRVTVTAVGYYPVPPYVPAPVSPTPSFPQLPYQPAPIFLPQPQPCGPISPVGVDPAQRVFGAAVLEARFPDYSLAVVAPLADGWDASVSGATSLVVWQAPGCGGDVLAQLIGNLVFQGGRVSFSSAPGWVQSRFGTVRRLCC